MLMYEGRMKFPYSSSFPFHLWLKYQNTFLPTKQSGILTLIEGFSKKEKEKKADRRDLRWVWIGRSRGYFD